MQIRDEFPALDGQVFMNHAGVTVIPARSARALAAWGAQAQVSVAEDWSLWAKAVTRSRANAATLFGCSIAEVCLIHNTTHGLLIVANSLPWRPGDNVVAPEGEFPANVYPWRSLAARGVAVRHVPARDLGRFEIDDFADRIDSRTRLVAVSMAHYATGFRMPVERLSALCRERGALLCVDGIQGAGAIPINVESLGCDFFSAGGHKWMLSAEGLGALYIRRSAMEQMSDAMTGWIGRARPADYANTEQALAPAAKRFEEGSHAMALAALFEQSLALLLEVGQPKIWDAIRALGDRLIEGILARGVEIRSSRREEERSGIVSFADADPDGLVGQLKERKIFVAARGGAVRVSPHFYNQAEQIDQLLAALDEIKKGR